ncbi:hypothetical protein CDEST_06606 [Colletotrichum destructivum]|uniref:Uncharacterized protein n=1 Tax=Colletotrichum destructivum TaxID=34406 RepID=A0AAX4IE74_9PEZI|nr:hypothetical protein CDEST_06606 [Colletotrichum destructivum]
MLQFPYVVPSPSTGYPTYYYERYVAPPSSAQGYLGPLSGLPRPSRPCARLPHQKIATLPSYAPNLLFRFSPRLVSPCPVLFLYTILCVRVFQSLSLACRSWLSRARRVRPSSECMLCI